MTWAQRGSALIHRTLPDTRVSKRPGHATEHLRRPPTGGTSPDAGRAAARTRRRPAGPPSLAVVCRGATPHGDRRGPVRRARQRVPHGAGLAAGDPGPGAGHARAASPTLPRDGAAPHAAAVAAGPAPAPPRASGWGRTRGRGATLALTLDAKRGRTVAAATLRRGAHELDWVGKRATLAAQDDAPPRVERLAHSRVGSEQWRRGEAMGFADELAIQWVPTVGYAWTPTGTQVAVMTPGTKAKHALAGALELASGTLPHGGGPHHTHGRFRDLRQTLAAAYPTAPSQRIAVVVATDRIQQAKAVEAWLANHPRVPLLCWPTSCPRANPIERALGDGHDRCPRHHPRQRVRERVADVEGHLDLHGPWPSTLSDRSCEPAVTATIEKSAAEERAMAAACVYPSPVERFRCGANSLNHGTPNQDNSPTMTAVYHEHYAYDPVGNMVSMAHRTNGFTWTRHFGVGGLTPDKWGDEWLSHLGTDDWANPPSAWSRDLLCKRG